MGLETILGTKEEIRLMLNTLGIKKAPEKHPNPLVHDIIKAMHKEFFDEEEGLYKVSDFIPTITTEDNAVIAIALKNAGYQNEAFELVNNIKRKCFDNEHSVFYNRVYGKDEQPLLLDTVATSWTMIALKETGEDIEEIASGLKTKFLTKGKLFRDAVCQSYHTESVTLLHTNTLPLLALNKTKDPIIKDLVKKMKKRFLLKNKHLWAGYDTEKKEVFLWNHFLTCLAFQKAGEDITPYIEAAKKSSFSAPDKLFKNYGENSFSIYTNAVASIALQSINDPLGKEVLDAMINRFLTEDCLFKELEPTSDSKYSLSAAYALLALIGYTF